MNRILFLVLALSLAACSSSRKSASSNPPMQTGAVNTYKLKEVSTDETYGYTERNPIKVGGVQSGPANERYYLNNLTGPNGETISFNRKGSCCAFDSPNGFMGKGLLDMYEVTYDGLSTPVILYLNMYDKGDLKAPKGFRYRQ
jgi:hypothetical protein